MSCKSNFSNAQLGKKEKKISIFLLTFYMCKFILFDIKGPIAMEVSSSTHIQGEFFSMANMGFSKTSRASRMVKWKKICPFVDLTRCMFLFEKKFVAY